MDAGPDVETHHHHHTAHRWLDVALSVSAIAISLTSAILAFQHGDAMDRMVQQNAHMVEASTWPYVITAMSNGDTQGHELYKLKILNNGVGPAKVERLTLHYAGHRVGNGFELGKAVARDAGHEEDVRLTTSDVGGVLAARSEVDLITVARPFSPAWLVDAFRHSAGQIQASVCYCSIFRDCWLTNDDAQPVPVSDCRAEKPVPARAGDI